jgi:hypothetical protein
MSSEFYIFYGIGFGSMSYSTSLFFEKFYISQHQYKTIEECTLAVQKNGMILKYVPFQKWYKANQTCLDPLYKKMCTMAVKENAYAIQYVPYETLSHSSYEKICMIAVKQNPSVIQHVQRLTFEICMVAVQKYGSSLVHIKPNMLISNNPMAYVEICIAAIQENGVALEYIIITEEFTQDIYAKICMIAVQDYPTELKYVQYNTNCKLLSQELYEDICIAAIQIDADALEYVTYQSEKICMAAVQQNGWTLKHVIYDPSYPNVVMLTQSDAVRNEPTRIEIDGEKLTESAYIQICMTAVQQDAYALQYVQYTKLTTLVYAEICKIAICSNGSAIRYVNSSMFSRDEYIDLVYGAIYKSTKFSEYGILIHNNSLKYESSSIKKLKLTPDEIVQLKNMKLRVIKCVEKIR